MNKLDVTVLFNIITLLITKYKHVFLHIEIWLTLYNKVSFVNIS